VAKDPYRYFRIEARELLDGLGQGVLALEKGSGGEETVLRLLRLAHTLKGASRVVKQMEMARLAHAVEEVLSPHREDAKHLTRDGINELLRILDSIGAEVATLEPKGAPQPEGGRTPPEQEEAFETVRVDIGEMDTLLQGVSEAGVQLASLREDIEAVERAHRLASALAEQLTSRLTAEPNGTRQGPSAGKTASMAEELRTLLEHAARSLIVSADQTEREVAQVRDQAYQLRLVAARTIFSSLERAARDAAHTLDKRIDFQTSGGANRLDANVLAALRDALLHVVRNAVAHGIETVPERAAAGKSPVGRIRLDVERRSHRLVFTCSDDGRGIDADAVRRAAVGRGLISSADAASLSVEQATLLILRGGITTTGVVTEVSGRGVGLDVLRETVSRLKGDISVKSERGAGTAIEVCVPVSLSAVAALVVDAGGFTAAIPLDAIRRTLRVAQQDIVRSAEGDSVLCDGTAIPFLPLCEALRKQAPARTKAWSAVVVEADARSVVVGVDRLLGTFNVVMRPLPTLVDPIPIVAGASLDAEGNPQLVLDPVGIVAAARATRGAKAAGESAARAPVLIVDDSLTTRMLEQSILESAGYEVALATSAEEALVKARERHYGLFVVDVEMPGMNGFEFVEQTRMDPLLRDTPAILVTSRAAAEDRKRGEQVGARAYIVKGEFDQVHLLTTIHSLIG